MPISPVSPSPVPDFPVLSDRVTYNSKAFAWAQHMDNVYPAEMLALADNTYSNAGESAASAGTATTQAGIATDKAALTAADAEQTALDRTQTEQDRNQTGIDASSALSSKNAAAGSETNAAGDAAAVAAALASLSSGQVVSVNGLGGVVTLKTINSADITGTGDIALVASTGGTASGLTIANGYIEESYAPAAGSAFTVDFANGTVQGFTTDANTVITLPAPAAGKGFQLQIAFGGAHTLAFAGGAIGWAANTAPTFSGASGKTDYVNFTCNVAGTKWVGAIFALGVTS